MARKTLSPAARRARDGAIYALYLRGLSPPAIVDELGTTTQVVNKAIRRGVAATTERFRDAERLRLSQSELLEFLVREALDAWEESKKGHEITKVSTAAEGDGGKRRAEKTTRKQAGDPRFLSQAMSALSDLRRLWRLEAPPAEKPQFSEPVSLEEDARWYGNDAHDLAAQAAAAPSADFAVPGTVQGRGVR